jgi:hypothetical protein
MQRQRRNKLEGRKRKMQKKANGKGKKNDVVKKQKRVLPVNGTYTKNIVYKEVLTL